MGVVHDLCNCSDKPEHEDLLLREREGYISVTEFNCDTDKQPSYQIETSPPKHKATDNQKHSDEYSLDLSELQEDSEDDTPQNSTLNLGVNPLRLSPEDSVNTRWMKTEITATHARDTSMFNDSSPLSMVQDKAYEFEEEEDINYAEEIESWNQPSVDVFNRMEEIYEFILSIKPATRSYVWYSFDKQGANALKSKLYIPKMMYSYIVLFIKTMNKQVVPPKYKQLKQVLIFYTLEMIQLMPIEEKAQITKQHYDEYFLLHLEQIVEKRAYMITTNSP
eukprot:42878_1